MKTVFSFSLVISALAVSAQQSPMSRLDNILNFKNRNYELPSVKGIRAVNSGLWEDPATWDCACVPGKDTNVIIGDNHWVELASDAMVKHLLIDGSGGLGMPWERPARLTITGDFYCFGFIDPGLSTFQMELSANRKLTGWMDFNRLEIVGSYRLVADGTINITGEMVVDAATVESRNALHFYTQSRGFTCVFTYNRGKIQGPTVTHGLLNIAMPENEPLCEAGPRFNEFSIRPGRFR
jgi:hypothetical protein